MTTATSRVTRVARVATTLAAAGLVLAGCAGQTGGDLARLQDLARGCPPNPMRVAAYGATDVSNSGRSRQIAAQRLDAIHAFVTQVAVCRGDIKLVAFSSSPGATYPLFEGAVDPPGATLVARLRKVDVVVERVMDAVADRLMEAVDQLPGDGSDILSELELAREYRQQLGGERHFEVLVLTDAVQTRGAVVTNSPAFDSTSAVELAKRVTVPDLSGASVTVAGVGKVSGPPAPGTWVDAAKTFFNEVCSRTRAAACHIVTDYTPEGS